MSEPEVLWRGHEFAAGTPRRLVKRADSSRAVWERPGIDGWVRDDSRMKSVATADEQMLARQLRALQQAVAEMFADWGVELDDERMGYLVVQVGREALNDVRALLPPEPAAEPAPTKATP